MSSSTKRRTSVLMNFRSRSEYFRDLAAIGLQSVLSQISFSIEGSATFSNCVFSEISFFDCTRPAQHLLQQSHSLSLIF
uniref:Uncharacterized protein n=1 Tax=Octopus bimaculoides TaxID=37653 RepID=A0A0L8HN71_OCTBM